MNNNLIIQVYDSSEELKNFVEDFISKIKTFKSHVHGYERCNGSETPIMNTDLWIEANIEKYPDLIRFREYVHVEMQRLNIEKYSKYIYEHGNHYKKNEIK